MSNQPTKKKKINSLKEIYKLFEGKNFNKPNSYGVEGEDHINISLQSKLPIGAFLDPSYYYGFTNDIGGRFKSVLNIVYWLRSKPLNDIIRIMNRSELNLLTRSGKLKPLDNHLLVLLHYTYKKVMSNSVMISNIKDLPDDIEVLSYRTDRNSKVRYASSVASMVVPVITEIISAVKSNREPNYKGFIDNYKVREGTFVPPAIMAILEENKL